MDKNGKKKRYYSFVIIPHDAQGKPVNLKVSANLLYGMASVLLLLIIVAGSSFVYSTLLSRRLIDYTGIVQENRETKRVSKVIDELAQKDNELREMLGLKGWQNKIKLTTTSTISSYDIKLSERKESIEELSRWVKTVRSRLANTPASWPIYGQISSFFGYRAAPWRGFHGGIDIRAKYGAPARATADGIISSIGWQSGYGKTVEINHGSGVATLFGHCSGYAVVPGQKVKRGQVVCYVGTTGWTTGSHLHYEVRRYDRPINPIAYLNRNLLSASKLWR